MKNHADAKTEVANCLIALQFHNLFGSWRGSVVSELLLING